MLPGEKNIQFGAVLPASHKNVLDSDRVSLGVGPESDLGQGLVGERT